MDPMLNLPLAPWWKRFIAIIVDGAVLGTGYFVIFAVTVALFGASNSASSANQQQANSGQALLGMLVIGIFAAVPNALYYGLMNGSKRGQTVGKMALGIAVRDARTGESIGFWRAAGRSLMSVVFELLFYVPFILDSLAPLWDKRRQAWHDKVVHSVVVDLKP